ncbi:MAG: beta-ketoacyl synthase N-terminal-like domain-containing protein [Bdellovibrionota bacterium]
MNTVLTHLGIACALGNTHSEITTNAKALTPKGFCYVSEDVPNQNIPFFSVLDIQKTNSKKTDMRCLSLLDFALNQIIDGIENLKLKYPLSKLAIVIGSSNTGVHEAQIDIHKWLETNTPNKDFSFDKIRLGSPAIYLQEKTGFKGPSYTISTACSSSAKAFSSARNLIESNVCEAVLVGGVDARCNFAHLGFFSLSALSTKPTNPFSENRDGINLGEGVALFIMEKNRENENDICIKGIGESSDAYDLTSPDPTGDGAFNSMSFALEDASLKVCEIDYINMHGTGTKANDDMESLAIYNLFYKNGNNKNGDNKNAPLCASTKPLTGHTLGASGAIELALSWLMLKNNFIIAHKYDGHFDKNISPITLATGKENVKIKNILSNSFAFGGSNVSIILGKY